MPKKQNVTVAALSKTRGKVYTPRFVVDIMLDYAGYGMPGNNILQRHVMDNSCGDGAFLSKIVERYCQAFVKDKSIHGFIHSATSALAEELAIYVHGIEIDSTECMKCKERLNAVYNKYGEGQVEWDIRCADAMTVSEYDGRMDYVFGNPPYIRVHNLNTSYKRVKEYKFASQGMTDLFIVFYEIGFRMLSGCGKMCLITPSSWLTSKAGKNLRNYIKCHKNMVGFIDFGHFQAFKATTYSSISLFDKNNHDKISFSTYDEDGLHKNEELAYGDFIINDNFYFSDKETLLKLREIRNEVSTKYAKVKNGFATLADKIFIGKFSFDELTIDVIKASTGQWYKGIYPYDERGIPLGISEIKKYSHAYSYLTAYKEVLTKGQEYGKQETWFLYGRTQAIKDVQKEKISINTIIKNTDSIKLHKVGIGKGVYSGLYIITPLSFETIKDIIVCDDFINYIKALKNYKSGGYYTFSSKDLELYINYKANKNNERHDVFGHDNSLF